MTSAPSLLGSEASSLQAVVQPQPNKMNKFNLSRFVNALQGASITF